MFLGGIWPTDSHRTLNVAPQIQFTVVDYDYRCSERAVMMATSIRLLIVLLLCLTWVNVQAQSTGQEIAILFGSDHEGQANVYKMNADGSNIQPFINSPLEGGGVLETATLSPDGKTLAFTSRKNRFERPTSAIFLLDVESGKISVLSKDMQEDSGFPVWSPDGSRLAYLTKGLYGAYEQAHIWDAASGATEVLTTNLTISDVVHDRVMGVTSVDWSPDGKRLVLGVQTSPPTGQNILVVINADGSNPTQLTMSDVYATLPVWNWQSDTVYFLCELETQNELCFVDVQGAGYDLLTTDFKNLIPENSNPRIRWLNMSPDGRLLIQVLRDPNIYIYDIQSRILTKLTVGNTFSNTVPYWIMSTTALTN